MELHKKNCVPCEGGTPPMESEEIKKHLDLVDGWSQDGNTIFKEYSCKDFVGAISFVNAIADIAEKEGHHPDILVYSYKRVRVALSTHAIGGLSQNDFILASKIDKIRLS